MSEQAGRNVHTSEDWHPHRRGEAQVMAAILLVAEGRAPSVIVSNIAEGADIVDLLRGQADALGVRIELLERADGHGHDVRVHAGGDRRVAE